MLSSMLTVLDVASLMQLSSLSPRLPVVSTIFSLCGLCFKLHDAFITTVFVPLLPKMPATAQIFGQPLLIFLSSSYVLLEHR